MLPDPAAVPGTDLPVRAVLPRVVEALAGSGAAVLVAPPGTGKTTLAPLAVAGAVPGRVLVAEPRRVAVRAAAHRMATLVGGGVGGAVGYAVRGERRVGPDTRIEVVTTGVLVRRLQGDPELRGVDAVILDECHERHLDTDLALAFLLDVRAALRPELWLLAASATAEADRLAGTLAGPDGGPAPVLTAPTALYPVETVWCPPARPVRPPDGLWVDPKLLDHVAGTVRRALREVDGDVLVFLPGAGEIDAVAGRLRDSVAGRLCDARGEVDVARLHGRLPAAVQDAALRPGPRRRIVLATAVAESSLTVPGVRIVVDAGLARVPRTDHARGLGSLVTVRLSRASAHQRAGRAGREAPGRVYRCWSAAEHDRLAGHTEPEVAVADLTAFALELACWGHPGGTGLMLPDQPPSAAMEVAGATLRALGALDEAGRVTARGRRLAAVGTTPRLARALLDGAGLVGQRRAAEVVALLSDDTLIGATDDLVAGWRRLRGGTDRAAAGDRSGVVDRAAARWREETRRLRSALPAAETRPAGGDPIPDDLAAGLLVGLAFPERLGQAREAGASTYLMAGGTAAELAPGSALAGSGWLAIAVADRAPGRAAARVRVAAAIDEATAREAGAPLCGVVREVRWSAGDVVARQVERLGAIELAARRLSNPDPALVAAAVRDGLRRDGLEILRWTPAARSLRQRLAFCHACLGAPWPDVADPALLDRADDWLGPELDRARCRADLSRIDVAAALRRLLPWPEAGRLDTLAPERLEVPSGSRAMVDYQDPHAPALAVKVQEAFGWAAAPTIGDGAAPVVVHLLSPAGRPVAVTRDLASFWRTGYRQVRAELRGRYPRHPWPEDPTTAAPTRRLQPRGR